MKRIYLLFVLLGLTTLYLVKPAKAGFSLDKIRASIPHHSEWECRFDELHAGAILSQPFSYLATGAESYVFVSEDDRYVIKFFKMNHLQPKPYLKLLKAIPSFRAKAERKEKKLANTFKTLILAYDTFQEETGLIYLHLNQTQHLKQKISLRDKAGKLYHISADDYLFTIQKKADLVYERIGVLLRAGQKAEALDHMQAILRLVEKRCQQGLRDQDRGISNNYGFVGTTPVQIDIGRVIQDDRMCDPEETRQEVERVANKMNAWLRTRLESNVVGGEGQLKEAGGCCVDKLVSHNDVEG